MSSLKRIKLHFESPTVGRNRRSWFLFDSNECRLVSDLIYQISERFGLTRAYTVLKLDDYVIPPSESIKIIRDNDAITISTSLMGSPDVLTPKRKKLLESPEGVLNAALRATQPISNNGHFSSSSDDLETESSSDSDSDEVTLTSKKIIKSVTKATSVENCPITKTRNSSTPTSISKTNQSSKPGVNNSSLYPYIRKAHETRNTSKPISAAKTSQSSKSGATGGFSYSSTKKALRPIKTTKKSVPVPVAKTSQSKTGGTHIRFEDTGNESEESNKEDSAEEENNIQIASEEKLIKTKEQNHLNFVPLDLASTHPKTGDTIRYKVLELTPDYTPNPSAYKEGVVVSLNLSNKTVVMQLSKETICLEKERIEEYCKGKFSLSDEINDNDVDCQVEVGLSEMIEPLIGISDS